MEIETINPTELISCIIKAKLRKIKNEIDYYWRRKSWLQPLKMLKERGYDVTLVERNEDVCRKIAEDTDTDVICGDGTDIAVLNDAGIMRADIIAAVTGNDEKTLSFAKLQKRLPY